MSIRVMSAVWAIALPDSEKLVMLALADWSDDAGYCWPSVAKLAAKCSKSERTIQGALRSLESKGHLTRDQRPGYGCKYTVHPRSDCTPAAIAPPQPLPLTPAAVAPNTSRHTTTLEAKASKANGRTSDFDAFWEAYPRKVGKLAALTAWKRLKPPLAECVAAIARYRQAKPADIDFCHPATWLNQGRWMDEHSTATGPPVTVDPARTSAAIAEREALFEKLSR